MSTFLSPCLSNSLYGFQHIEHLVSLTRGYEPTERGLTTENRCHDAAETQSDLTLTNNGNFFGTKSSSPSLSSIIVSLHSVHFGTLHYDPTCVGTFR